MNRQSDRPDDQSMQSKLLLCLAPLLLSFGCGSEGPLCSETAHLYQVDQPNAHGVTGKSFAQHALGVHPIELSLTQPATGPSSVTPAFPDKTPGTLTISIAPGAQWTHVISEPGSSKGIAGPLAARSCVDYYNLPVQARLTAFNGTIDEVWTGLLVGTDMNDPQAQLVIGPNDSPAYFTLNRDASSFLGNFKVAAPQLPSNHTLSSHVVSLSASFKDGALVKASMTTNYTSQPKGSQNSDVSGAGSIIVSINPRPSAH